MFYNTENGGIHWILKLSHNVVIEGFAKSEHKAHQAAQDAWIDWHEENGLFDIPS